MRWFEQHRMEWIAETLRIFGFINREHLIRKFGLSTPQASTDLNRFTRLNPKAMTYDKSAKRYVATATHKPSKKVTPMHDGHLLESIVNSAFGPTE